MIPEHLQKTLLDLNSRQLAHEHLPCPRCGRDSMNRNVLHNALSRHADIHICDECGSAEAMLDFMQNPLPLDQWACFLPERLQGDLRALPSDEAWELVKIEQLPFLTRLYERWLDEPAKDDFGPYRAEAYRNCPGLTHLWYQPFMAAYDVHDGRLLLRFRNTGNETEVAHDLVGKF